MFRRCVLAFSGKIDVSSAYRVLGVASGAPMPTIKQRYLQLAKQYHPDLNHGDDSKMKAVNVAYEAVVQHVSVSQSSTGKDKDSTQSARAQSYAEKYGFKERGRRRSPISDHEAWTSRSEYDWTAAVSDVTESEAADPRNHPDSFNKYFSWEEDLTIFRGVKSGASVSQVGRSVGKTPLSVERRLNHPQFKQRMRHALKSQYVKKEAKDSLYESLDPVKRSTVRRSSVRSGDSSEDDWLGFGGKEDRGPESWTADNVMSPMGKSYYNFRHYHNRSGRGRRTV